MIPIINKRETGIKLHRLMDERGITVKQVQEYLGLGSVQSVYHWLNGISMPTLDNLYALSELFQIPIDAMICGNRKPFVPQIDYMTNESRDERFYTYYEKMHQKHAA